MKECPKLGSLNIMEERQEVQASQATVVAKIC